MNSDNSRAAFLELYVALTRALSTRKGSRYPKLKELFTDARKLHGEFLTSLIGQWYTETSPIAEAVAASDEKVMAADTIPPCMAILCLDEIFSEPNFSKASRANLWLYLQGLVLHAKEFSLSEDEQVEDEEIPAPAGPGVEFGNGTEAQLKAVSELTSALPPNVLAKMHGLAQNYQNELTEGKKDVSEMSFSKILQDVVGTLDTNDIMSFVGNIDSVVKTMQKSQTLPEVQALMRSMRQAGVAETEAKNAKMAGSSSAGEKTTSATASHKQGNAEHTTDLQSRPVSRKSKMKTQIAGTSGR